MAIDQIIRNRLLRPAHDTDVTFVHGLGRPAASGEVGLVRLRGIRRAAAVTFRNPQASIVQVGWREYSGHTHQYYYVAYDEGQWMVRFLAASRFLTTTGLQSITLDATFNTASNFVTCIGASNRGANGASTSTSGGGSGGAACSRGQNYLGPTTMTCAVGAAAGTATSAGGDSWINSATVYPSAGTTGLGAKGVPAMGSLTQATGGAPGPSSGAFIGGSYVASLSFSGGTGGAAGASTAAGGGGGGAAGWHGAGAVPGTGPSTGGGGDAGFGGGGGGAGSPGSIGSNGPEYDSTHGAGGGGGGANAGPGTGGAGGNYGAGGGGGGRSNGTGGFGTQGLVVFESPLYVLNPLPQQRNPILAQ